MTSKVTIPTQAVFILRTLANAGFEVYVVGGAVRDIFLNGGQVDPHQIDFDFTTNAKPQQILELINDSFYENEFGTVMVSFQNVCEQMGVELKPIPKPTANKSNKVIDLAKATKVHESLQNQTKQVENTKDESVPNYPNFEITTFRSDGIYSDSRRPDSVEWGESIEEDLKRRDFTINAMAIKIAKEDLLSANLNNPQQKLELDYELIDPHQGRVDLGKNLIRTVGDTDTRIKEDALRMLRAIRFSVQLNFKIDDETLEAIFHNSHLIQKVSQERIRDELLKMLASDYPAESIELLDQSGLLQFVLPELERGKGVEQGGHHTTDVWTHSLEALRECPARDPIVRLATLLHDVAKPDTAGINNGDITFYNHEIVGSRVAYKIAKRLKLSKKDCQRIFTLVRYHMFHYQPHNSDASIRRFMRKVGLENIDDILDLREGDRLGSGARKTSWRLEEMKQRMIDQLHQPMDTRDLAINGNDLMKNLHIKPGPVIGEILQKLLEEVLENPELNTKDKLLEISQKLISKNKR